MQVFLLGATGFLGRALAARLSERGHGCVAWVRDLDRARRQLAPAGAGLSILQAPDPNGDGEAALARALSGCDAVVNLAGEPIFPARWTPERRRSLRESRVGVTDRLVRAIERASPRPRVLVSGSAVGLYGDRGDEPLTEQSAPGADFLAQLCVEWEAAALQAERSGLRVALLRTGVVLGAGGGALASLLPPFRLGLGGPIGSGAQHLPWIHLRDWVALALFALEEERATGPLNATAPEPATSRDFARALGAALGRPAFLPLPAFALRAAMGEAASVLLGGQRALPRRAQELGFRFEQPALGPALADLVGGPPR